MTERRYCRYCGRVSHRCACFNDDSRLRQLNARRTDGVTIEAAWISEPYKRGVPPQIKRRERATLRRHYDDWYVQVCERDGAVCANCGTEDDLVLDHIISIAKGGLSDMENLQLLCAECNRIKGKLCIDLRRIKSPVATDQNGKE